MFQLFKDFTLLENQKKANEEVVNAINEINEVYKEWKKTKRRKNAVNIVTTSVNKVCRINPATINYIHDTARLKLAAIIMRCMDIPPWMDLESKRITYRRLYPLLEMIQTQTPNTGTDGNLREVIMTRLSASISYNCEDPKEKNVFVAYEPKITKKYLRYIFGEEMPENICKMQTLPLPKDFDTLINTLKINHQKACDKYNNNGENK